MKPPKVLQGQSLLFVDEDGAHIYEPFEDDIDPALALMLDGDAYTRYGFVQALRKHTTVEQAEAMNAPFI